MSTRETKQVKALIKTLHEIKDHCREESLTMRKQGGFSASAVYADMAVTIKAAIDTYNRDSQAKK